MPSHDGLPHLPDLDDMQQLEAVLIPALEEWVLETERKTDSWAIRWAVLVMASNRLLALKTTADVAATLSDLVARIERLEQRR